MSRPGQDGARGISEAILWTNGVEGLEEGKGGD
jgi:hypothetical protein